MLPVCGLVIQLQNMLGFHLNLLFLLGGWSFLVESAWIKFQHRVQEFPAQGAPEKTSCQEQEGVEGGWLLLSYNSHNPEGQEMMLSCKHCSGESNDKCVCVLMCTCVLISSGIVFCWIQEWTSASSSLCSWVNQGWRGWSTRSFSLSSANTSVWSLHRQDTEQSANIRKRQIKTKLISKTTTLSHYLNIFCEDLKALLSKH